MKLKSIDLRKAGIAAAVGLAFAGMAVVGTMPATSGVADEGTASQAVQTQPDWKAAYPAQYYSFIDGGDDMDDMGGFITRTEMPHSHATLYGGMGNFGKATCVSCKSTVFNEWFDEYGYDVFYERYSDDWTAALTQDDVWSCGTCHSDINDPAGSVGAQIMTFELFGGDLLKELDPATAACGQCHNGLGPWNNLRILDGVDLENTEVSAYRYGTDPEAMLRATLEDATESSESSLGRTWSSYEAGHGPVSEEHGIYRIDSGGHFDVETFQGSAHQQAGLTCASCHMPQVTGQDGEVYSSHDASGSPLDSYAAMTMCLDCHGPADGVQNQEEMVAFVQEAQAELAAHDAEVAAKQNECFDVLVAAIESGDFDEETLDQARADYAAAFYYREYVFNEAEEPGEKVAHNPELCHEFLDRAAQILDDVMATLQQA